MPFHRPIPDDKPPLKGAGALAGYVAAEKMMQIAFVLPAAVVIGLALGMWADHLLHQKWIVIVGIVFGSAAGLVYVIRMALNAEKASRSGNDNQNGIGKGSTDDHL